MFDELVSNNVAKGAPWELRRLGFHATYFQTFLFSEWGLSFGLLAGCPSCRLPGRCASLRDAQPLQAFEPWSRDAWNAFAIQRVDLPGSSFTGSNRLYQRVFMCVACEGTDLLEHIWGQPNVAVVMSMVVCFCCVFLLFILNSETVLFPLTGHPSMLMEPSMFLLSCCVVVLFILHGGLQRQSCFQHARGWKETMLVFCVHWFVETRWVDLCDPERRVK